MLRTPLLWLSEQKAVFSLIRKRGWARRLASRFVAGETIVSAVEAARALNADGITASLDLLGESVTDAEEASRAAGEIVATLEEIASSGVDANVSVKLTQMGIDLDSELCVRNMERVLDRAAELNIFVRIDMEGSPYTERTLALFRDRFHPKYGNGTGVVIQSYMRRSAADVAMLADMHARVRLCKGAYAEPPEIAFQERSEVSRSYVASLERLLVDGTYPAIATHDERLIRHAIAFVSKNEIPPERFEFQMLYGVRRDLQRRLKAKGYNVRVYVPFGTQWYPYLMRRLAERPANVAFMAISVLKEAFTRK